VAERLEARHPQGRLHSVANFPKVGDQGLFECHKILTFHTTSPAADIAAWEAKKAVGDNK